MRGLRESLHAYPLEQLAHLFLSRSEYRAIKLELRRDPRAGRPEPLCQCQE